MFDAVIFDLDGLLLDTESVALEAGVEALAQFGHRVPVSVMAQLIGKDEATGAAVLRDYLGVLPDPEALKVEWDAACDRRFAAGIAHRPGVVMLLDALDALALPRAIATSSRMGRARAKLELAGLQTRFGTIVSVECVTNPKPAPDPYLHAAGLLGQDPARCLAFEDSDTGALSARRAGLTVVQVPDLQLTDGRYAHLLAPSLMEGARGIGLLR